MWRVLLLTSVALSGFGCGGGTSSNAPRNNGDTSNEPTQVSKPNAADVNKPPEPGTPEVPTEGSIADRIAKRIERSDAEGNTTPPGRPAPLRFEPAPENSEAAVSMQHDGSILEVRVFRNHAQLARAEARWFATGPKNLKISLKNGRIVTVETDRVANLKTVPTHLLVELATTK